MGSLQSGLMEDHGVGLLGKTASLSGCAKAVIAILLTVTIATAGLAIGGLVETLDVKKKVNKLATAEPTAAPLLYLPAKFEVPAVYQNPATDQDGLGTCWAWSTMYVLEAQYRAQGIAKGFLKPDEWVKFSTQAYFSYIGKRCLSEANPPKVCYYGGLMQNSSEDGQIEALYYFAKAWDNVLLRSILPDAVCPYNVYHGEPFDYFKCDGIDEALAQNPIKWSIKSQTTVLDLTAIKRLLVEKNRSLAIGTPLSDLVYYPSCADAPWNWTADCIDKSVPCPDGPDGAFCHKYVIDGRFQDGVFLGETDVRKMAEAGGHAMNIVAYNDDWIEKDRFQAPSGSDSAPQLRGGFILHNSWTSQRGHSVSYLLGDRTQENEDVLCPNHVAPTNWIPASLDCLANATDKLVATLKAGVDKPVIDCSKLPGESVIERVRGAGIARTADVLVCVSSLYCKTGNDTVYVMAKEARGSGDLDVKYLASGLHKVGVLELDVNSGNITKHTFDWFPFWSLSKMFRPHPLTLVPNNADACGWWMLPYQTYENMRRLNWDLLDNFRVWDLEVEFDNQSYANSPASDAFNTTLLKLSTHTQKAVEFDGPLPFDIIYNETGL